VVNVSSPNTPGLRELQEKEPLKKILTHLQGLNTKFKSPKPILLKIAPDLSQTQIDDVIELSQEIKLDGLVVANTSLDRSKLITSITELENMGAGGLSGLPVKNRATEMVQYIYQKTKGSIPIIASGGIFTGADAAEKLDAGASLVQVWTGFVYEGPAIVKKISSYLATSNKK
jgi:dihydroorotate dehydrogenase